jgi:hypothetical protein
MMQYPKPLANLICLFSLCLLPCSVLQAYRPIHLESPKRHQAQLARPHHTQRFFVEASLGHGKVEEKRNNTNMDNAGAFHNLSMGYWLTSNIAIEATYADFHDVSYKVGNNTHKDTKNHFYGMGLRASLQASNTIDLFASLGVGSSHRRIANGVTNAGMHEGFTTYYAAGSKWHIARQLDAMIKATASKEAFGHTHGVPPMYGIGAGLALNL